MCYGLAVRFGFARVLHKCRAGSNIVAHWSRHTAILLANSVYRAPISVGNPPGQGDSRVREKHNRFCAVSLGYTGRGLKLDGIMLAARLG